MPFADADIPEADPGPIIGELEVPSTLNMLGAGC